MNCAVVERPLTVPSPPVGERVASGRVRGLTFDARNFLEISAATKMEIELKGT